jgi:hypothetical protein
MIRKVFLGLAIFALSLIVFTPALAAENLFSDTVNVSTEQTINDNVFAVGGTVDIGGKVVKDLTALGGDITISGDVTEDVTAAGGNIRITGKVGDDLRAVGGTIKIAGKVKNDVLVLGGTVTVEPGGEVGGDLEVYGGTVEIAGTVNGQLRGNTSTAIISGKVGKNVSMTTRDIKLAQTAQLGGDFTYTSSEAATIQSGSIIAGKVSHNFPQNISKKSSVTSSVLSALAYILLGIVLVLLLPKSLKEAKEELIKNFWPSLLVGVLSLVVVPTLFLVLVVTIIGAPIGIILLVLYGVAVYVGKIVVGLLLGEKLLQLIEKNQKVSMVWAAVFGLAILLIIFQIPFVGGILNFVATLFGLGALVLWIKNIYLATRKHKEA